MTGAGDPGDLRESLRDLIPDYRGPADPFLRVGASIRRRRRRTRTWLTVGSAATAAAVTALVPLVIASLHSAAPASTAQRAGAPPGLPAPPAPITPAVHPVAKGVVAGVPWQVGSTSLSDAARRCLLATGGPFVRDNACFDGWAAGGAVTWSEQLVSRPGGPAVTAVLGVAPDPAVQVAVRLADGRTVRSPAVRTPTDPDARFFALVLERDTKIRSVTAFAAGDRPLGDPVTDPGATTCTPAPNLGCAVPASPS